MTDPPLRDRVDRCVQTLDEGKHLWCWLWLVRLPCQQTLFIVILEIDSSGTGSPVIFLSSSLHTTNAINFRQACCQRGTCAPQGCVTCFSYQQTRGVKNTVYWASIRQAIKKRGLNPSPQLHPFPPFFFYKKSSCDCLNIDSEVRGNGRQRTADGCNSIRVSCSIRSRSYGACCWVYACDHTQGQCRCTGAVRQSVL